MNTPSALNLTSTTTPWTTTNNNIRRVARGTSGIPGHGRWWGSKHGCTKGQVADTRRGTRRTPQLWGNVGLGHGKVVSKPAWGGRGGGEGSLNTHVTIPASERTHPAVPQWLLRVSQRVGVQDQQAAGGGAHHQEPTLHVKRHGLRSVRGGVQQPDLRWRVVCVGGGVWGGGGINTMRLGGAHKGGTGRTTRPGQRCTRPAHARHRHDGRGKVGHPTALHTRVYTHDVHLRGGHAPAPAAAASCRSPRYAPPRSSL
jgi:hypothetical protein